MGTYGFMKLGFPLFPDATQLLAPVISTLAVVSIIYGACLALVQNDIKKIIAYSSISHLGFVMLGLVSLELIGIQGAVIQMVSHAGYLFYAFLGDAAGRFQAVAFYVVAYGAMNLLAFASLPAQDDDAARDRLENLSGLYQRHPFSAVMIAIALLSLAGIPPFPGFVAKFLIFRNVMAAGFTLYAVLGLIASYVGIYFYLRAIQYLFMIVIRVGLSPRKPKDPLHNPNGARLREAAHGRVAPKLRRTARHHALVSMTARANLEHDVLVESTVRSRGHCRRALPTSLHCQESSVCGASAVDDYVDASQ